MEIIKKLFKVSILAIVSIILLITFWWFWPERTPQIKSIEKGAISTIDYIEIGGVQQCVLVRSENYNNPIILFLHGGPGMPMMYLSHGFQRPLENNFTVVQWDRRGAGKTFSRNKPTAETINTRQLINDAYELIDTLRSRYNQNKIVLVGHSFGTYLGSIMVNERPELFSAYISIGQVVDNGKSKIVQEAFIREQANLKGKTEILTELNKPDKPNFENWLFEFGGELKNSKSFFPLVWLGIQAPEYTLPEVFDVAKGSSFSSLNMNYNVLSNSIYYEITEYHIPIYFFIGKSDYTTPHELVSEYYDLIKAPNKELIYFENSAHFPFIEEPDKFCSELKRVLLNQ